MDPQDIITQGAAAAGFAKILVDLVKMSPLPAIGSLLPVLAFVFAEASAFLLAATGDNITFNRQTIAITVLIGISATAGAIALTAAQTKGDKVEERVDAALDAPPGTTKAQIDAKVKGTGDGK